MTFEALNLHKSLCDALHAEGYTSPTPIQSQAIPHALAGKDVIGCAQTGTGKTAAFALPILQRLIRPMPGTPVRCLVLTPTRELATQIDQSFGTYGRGTQLRHTVVYGGVSEERQVQALRRGVDILVATPGRLLALMSRRAASFHALEILVLDEADRMLDMGFIRDVKRIVAALPRKRQTLFFSATMPPDIQALAKSMLVDPVRVEVATSSPTVDSLNQQLFHVEQGDKRALLLHLLQDTSLSKALVFTRTKSGANRVAKHLHAAGVAADSIHGDKSQNARERALVNFKRGAIRILVATDIAARGIDIDAVTHVINFDMPNIPESYIHRVGRTGRAGAAGVAFSFVGSEERGYVRDIERSMRRKVPVNEQHPYRSRAETRNSSAMPAGRRENVPESRFSGRDERRSRSHRAGGRPNSSVDAGGRRFNSGGTPPGRGNTSPVAHRQSKWS